MYLNYLKANHKAVRSKISHCYYGVNDGEVHVQAFQLWNISDFFPAAVDTGPTAEWGTWLE